MSNRNSEEHKKPQKRLEYIGKNVRISRTGGVAVTKTFKKDGVGVTLNTKHGIRLHKRLFKGARMGFQNGNFLIHGLLLAMFFLLHSFLFLNVLLSFL
jgi:hypothetical protein